MTNTATTIVTFLVVFLIQNTQNRDMVAFQAKLDELIRVCEAENHFIGIEHLAESEVKNVRSELEHEVEELETDNGVADEPGYNGESRKAASPRSTRLPH